MIELIVPGKPQGKQRPRWSKVGTYTPKKTVSYETYVKELFLIKYPDHHLYEGALSLSLTICLGIPASTSKKKKALMLNGNIYATKLPDIDNVIKIICDALQGIAYKNDSQIIRLTAFKTFSEAPRVEIRLRRV